MRTMKTVLVLIGFLVASSLSAQVLVADANQSEITWVGKKVTGQHNGTVDLKSGRLELDGNVIVSGEFVLDMTSIKNLDLPGGGSGLVDHLKSEDFFGTENHPEAKLVITERAPFSGNTATVNANLTIKDITNPVSFEVTKENNNTYIGEITIDRTEYDIRYRSGSFFDNLGDQLINDDFEIGVTLVVL